MKEYKKVKCSHCSGTGFVSEEIYECQCGWKGTKAETTAIGEMKNLAVCGWRYFCPICKNFLDEITL